MLQSFTLSAHTAAGASAFLGVSPPASSLRCGWAMHVRGWLVLPVLGALWAGCAGPRIPDQAAAITAAVVQVVPDQAAAVTAAAVTARPTQAAEIAAAAIQIVPDQTEAITAAAIAAAPAHEAAIRWAARLALDPTFDVAALPGPPARPVSTADEARREIFLFLFMDRLPLPTAALTFR
jgi:hypothetical protein